MPPKKAQAVYKDTPNNRKLNRVGKPLGDPQFKVSKSAVNIIIIYNRTGGIYKTGDKELFFKKRNTIFIYYYDQTHFEAMSVETKEGQKTLFDYDTNIVRDIKKFL